MGGWGSGRSSGRQTTEDYLRFDVRKLTREYLRPGVRSTFTWTSRGVPRAAIGVTAAADRIAVEYRQRRNGEAWESMAYPIHLERTKCNLGGERTWFLCPGVACGRRVATLYFGRYLLCRHCLSLAYQSQREAPLDRSLRRAQKALDRFPNSICLADGIPPKPKGMHWATYERLSKRFRHVEQIMLVQEVRHFGLNFDL
jgi:hypothetical protein